MNSTHLVKALLLAFVAGAVLHTSCSPASYEIIRGKKNKNSDSGSPETVQPIDENPDGGDRNQNQRPSPTPSDDNLPPTARVEVIWNGKSVTQVLVNQPVMVQPSTDTVDPDDVGKSSCRNPGIVEAEYDLDGGVVKGQERGESCKSLAVPHTFTKTGEYLIQMVVISNENEIATAAMVLKVVDTERPYDMGFTISAKPMLVGVGQNVAFRGDCRTPTPNTISWDFADGEKASGIQVNHRYGATGQYKVTAFCVDESGHEMTAWVTIVVIDHPVDLPTDPNDPFDPTDPTVPPPGGPTDPTPPPPPGQKPIQKPGQKPIQKPGQEPIPC